MEISVTDAKGQLTELVRRAEAGDEVILDLSRAPCGAHRAGQGGSGPDGAAGLARIPPQIRTR